MVKEVRKKDCDPEGKLLTLTTVFDWRKRDKEWKRRCRIVCGQEQWFSHLCAVLERFGFEAFKGIPSVLSHKVRPVVVSVCVDDELIAGKKGQGSWLVKELQKFFTSLQLHYLKRNYEFVDEGILVSVSKRHYEKLQGLYDLGNRKEKMTPENQLLGSKDETKELASEDAKKFRSALGTMLYMSQDRWDVQRSEMFGFTHGQANRDGSQMPPADVAVCEGNGEPQFSFEVQWKPQDDDGSAVPTTSR